MKARHQSKLIMEDIKDYSMEDIGSKSILHRASVMNFEERWVLFHKHINAIKDKDEIILDATEEHIMFFVMQENNLNLRPYKDVYKSLTYIIDHEGCRIENLNDDQQNESLEQLYKIITMCIGQDFEVVDKQLQDKPFDPSPSEYYGTHFRIVSGSFATIKAMSQLCQDIKRLETEKMYLKMAIDFILRSFDKSGHLTLIDLILSQSVSIISNYIVCMKKLNRMEMVLEDLTSIISTFERLGEKKPKNYGHLLKAKGEALEVVNRLDEAIVEYKKSIKCSKRYFLYHIKSTDARNLVLAYEESSKYLYKLYTKLGRHQEATEVLEKFLETLGPDNQTKLHGIGRMKLNLAKSHMRIGQYSEAKQSLLSITHAIRDDTKKCLAELPISDFVSGNHWYVNVFDVLELYLQCIKLKPSSKKKSLPKIAQHLFDHMKNDDFLRKNLRVTNHFNEWVETIVAVTLDCLKDNIQYVDLNEIYVLKLKYMVTKWNPDSHYGPIKFGLKVLKVLKEKNGLDYIPQVCQQIYKLYLNIHYVHEALDLKMESADYSSIDWKWHMDMANCYLKIDQYEEAWSHIKDAQKFPDYCDVNIANSNTLDPYDANSNTIALYCIKTGQHDLSSILEKSQAHDRRLMDLQTLALFKSNKIQECFDYCVLHQRSNVGITLSLLMHICSTHLLDKNSTGQLIQIIHTQYAFDYSSMQSLLEPVWRDVLNHKGVRSGGFDDFLTEVFKILNIWKEKFQVKRNELRLYENAFQISYHIRKKKIY